MRRIGPMLAIVSLAGVGITGCAHVSAAPPSTSQPKTLQERLDEPFTSVLRSCLVENSLTTVKKRFARKFKGESHVIPRPIAKQHEKDLKAEAFVYPTDLGGLFYSLWSEDDAGTFSPRSDLRFDLRERSIESSGDLALGGNVKTRHLFDCSMVIAAAINADVSVPTSVIKAALKNSYSFDGSQNAGISLLYARFDSKIPDALDRETVRDAKDVFDINLDLWRTYRQFGLPNSQAGLSKLRILKSLEGFSVNTAQKFSTGYQAINEIDAAGSLGFLKAHGSVTLNSQLTSGGSSVESKFITTERLGADDFLPAPSLSNLVQLVAQSGNRLIKRDVGFPAQLDGDSAELPYSIPLPQQLCSQASLTAADGSSTVKTEWKTEPTAYCRVVRTLSISSADSRTQSVVSTEFKAKLKYTAESRVPEEGDVVFTFDSGGQIDNPRASFSAESITDRNRLEIRDFFIEGTIVFMIRAPFELTATPPNFSIQGRCQDNEKMESVSLVDVPKRLNANNVWELGIKYAISNASVLKSKGGRCTFDAVVTLSVQGTNPTPGPFSAKTFHHSFDPPQPADAPAVNTTTSPPN